MHICLIYLLINILVFCAPLKASKLFKQQRINHVRKFFKMFKKDKENMFPLIIHN